MRALSCRGLAHSKSRALLDCIELGRKCSRVSSEATMSIWPILPWLRHVPEKGGWPCSSPSDVSGAWVDEMVFLDQLRLVLFGLFTQ